jgi:Fe-Mn family superoxide dismutase
VTNLNNAVKGKPDLENMKIDALLRDINKVPADIKQAVINNGGGHYNHTMFWELMTPGGSKEPKGGLADAIAAHGGVEKLKADINDAGMKRFGSGWSWLVVDGGHLKVLSTANQDCPLMQGQFPVLGVDVWEHAYYLKYQNLRADYLKAWWNVVNWDEAGKRYEMAMKK